MGCCGQKRRAMTSSAAAGVGASSSSRAIATPAVARDGRPGDVRLRYQGRGGFAMRSVRTGRSYTCGSPGAVVFVAPGDAEPLIRTRLFTPA